MKNYRVWYIGIALFAMSDLSSATELTLPEVAKRSAEINRLLDRGYQELNVRPAEIVDAPTFVRRAYIQIIGRAPTVAEAKEFLSRTSNAERHMLIERLIHSTGFQHKRFNFYADLLRLKTRSSPAGLGWHVWLKNAVEQNKPYDKMVLEMLVSKGHASRDPAVGYYLRDRDNLLDNVSNSAQIFLGLQIACAQCHDDPFGETTQLEYYQLAAYSAGMTYDSPFVGQAVRDVLLSRHPEARNAKGKLGKKFKDEIKEIEKQTKSLLRPYSQQAISQSDKPLRLPHDYQYADGEPNQVVAPRTFLGVGPNLTDHPTSREAFAAWVVSGNDRFGPTIVNRLWASVFGSGLREPLDNWDRSENVPHPEVLTALTRVLEETDYDIREVLRVLYHTQLFQRATSREEIAMGSHGKFQGPSLRRMTGEEIFDSLRTMQFGKIDEARNNALRESWATYVHSAHVLTGNSARGVTAINEALQANTKLKVKAKQALKSIKNEISQARKAGDTKRVDQLTQEKKRQDKAPKEYKKKDVSPATKAALALTFQNLTLEAREPVRAAEFASPFGAGSVVRRFGGSDRQTPNAGHSKPSIPQMLTMLNGEYTDKLTQPSGSIVTAVMQLPTDEQRLDMLFLQFYSCRPSDEERSQLEPMMTTRNGIAVVARAMLSSKRFLFVR